MKQIETKREQESKSNSLSGDKRGTHGRTMMLPMGGREMTDEGTRGEMG
jgi:hypothetical protein